MKTVTKTYNVCSFDELSDRSQSKAMSDYINDCDFSYHAECIIEDAKAIGALMGINIDNVYYSGFYSQGDGAMFTGSYSYANGSVLAVMNYAPNDTELHSIVKTLANIQRRNFYQLYANVKHYGHYYHSSSNIIDVERSYQDVSKQDEDELVECLRDFMEWIYNNLQKEYDHVTSLDYFKEVCEANDYQFLSSGELY